MTQLNGPEILPVGGAGAVKKLVVLLHGYGSNGDDLIGLASEWQSVLPHTAFVAPHAPHSVPMTYNGFHWFNIWDRTPFQIEQDLRAVIPAVTDYITLQAARFGLGLEDVALVGFSQGTMLSLHVGLRAMPQVAGIIGYAGAMLTPETLLMEKGEKLPPSLLVHGLMDNVVPWTATQVAANMIQMAGGTVETLYRPTLMHSIDRDGVQAGANFLNNVLNA